MIITGGMNVYPAEIEAALEQHPGIFDVAVFGIPSEQWGEQVHAAVVPAPGASLSEADVVAYARSRADPLGPNRRHTEAWEPRPILPRSWCSWEMP